MADDRSRAIDLALSQIEKQFGKGSIMRLGNKEAIVPIAIISTGSISFDAALGVGGVPRGRVIEIFGPESSGKTTITLQIIAEAQKAGGMAAFVDAEHALDPPTPKSLAWMSTTCSSRSPITASRRLKSLKHWSAPAPSMYWSSTQSPRWCPRPNSTAKWAIRTWDCRRA